MLQRGLFTCLLLFAVIHFSWGQSSADYLPWSDTRKLTVDDFVIKTKGAEANASFAKCALDYEVGGFDFLRKNFNKKVHNYFLKTASWIDTSVNVQQSLQYQQTLFNVSEIYTRKFRKALRENRKQIAKGLEYVKELNSQILTDFAKRRLDYDRETQSGKDTVKQQAWETQIRLELTELAGFAYDK